MPMKNPPHPGGLIRREIIKPLGLSVSAAAEILGVSRQAMSLLLNERTDLSSEMALRIEKAFGPKLDHLMRMQLAYDLARQTRRRGLDQGETVRTGLVFPGLLKPLNQLFTPPGQ